jgi:hypothetical protein
VVAGVGGELLQEGALGAAVAFAEWVDAVDLRQLAGQAVDEQVPVKAAEMAFGRELSQHVREIGLDVLGQREQVALGDRDGSDLARPRVDVAEDVAVKRLEVLEVVVPRIGRSASLMERATVMRASRCASSVASRAPKRLRSTSVPG